MFPVIPQNPGVGHECTRSIVAYGPTDQTPSGSKSPLSLLLIGGMGPRPFFKNW